MDTIKRSEIVRSQAVEVAKRRIPELEEGLNIVFNAKQKEVLRYFVWQVYTDAIINSDERNYSPVEIAKGKVRL